MIRPNVRIVTYFELCKQSLAPSSITMFDYAKLSKEYNSDLHQIVKKIKRKNKSNIKSSVLRYRTIASRLKISRCTIPINKLEAAMWMYNEKKKRDSSFYGMEEERIIAPINLD